MTRHGWILALLWAISLVAVSGLTLAAQAPRGRASSPGAFTLETPTILTGADLGFRLDRVQDGVPIGRVVVRIDGTWVEPQAR